MRINQTITSLLLLSVATGCSLIKVNGKPLGGGSSNATTSASSEPASSSSSSSSSGTAKPADKYVCEGLFGSEYRDCESRETQRKNEILDAPNKEARGKLPAFCKEYHFSDYQDVEAARFKDFLDPKQDVFVAASMFGEVMCAVRGKLDDRPKVMEIRAKWMKLRGLDELDFVTAIGLQKNQTWGSQDKQTLGPAVAQMEYVTALKLDHLGAKVSMLGAFAWVKTCMGGMREDNSGHPLEKLLCLVEPLDVARADAEIEATPKINQETRFNLRQLVRQTAKEQARFKTLLAAVEKEEPTAVRKLLEIAEQQRREWSQPSPARKKLIALVEQMEEATASNKRSVFAGCDATTHSAWAEIVRAAEIPAVSTKGTTDTMRRAVFTTAEAYLAYQALGLCIAGLSPDGRSDDRIGSSVVRRGWRSSTIAAWFAASGQIKFDNRKLDMGTVLGNSGREDRPSSADEQSGTIAKLTTKGSKVTVEFKEVTEEYEDCIDWVPTNRINKIDSSGNIYYVNKCTKVGMVKADRTPGNVELDALFAQGLKPGMRMVGSSVATANAKSSKAVWLFGVSLK